MKNKPCVLIIGPTPPPYMGPSVGTKMIVESEELREKFQIVHLDTADRRDLTNIGKMDFLNIYLASYHVVKLLVLLIQNAPNIVYLPICQTVRGFLRDAAFIILSRLFGARVVIHLRGGYFRTMYDRSNMLTKLLIRSVLKTVSRAIVLGKTLRYIFEGLIPSKHIVVVPNGINQMQDPPVKKYYQSPNNKIRILFLSALARPKGFIDTVKSIPIVITKVSNVEYVFAGELYTKWGEKDEFRRLIEENKINDYINYVGIVTGKDKCDLLSSSDIFVFPTYYYAEGQPWAIIEAMAAGLPVITTNQGCINEMVRNGKNGFIVEKRNYQEIAEKTILLITNRKLRCQMGACSREIYLQNYTRDKFINGLSCVFSESMI
jgi:glycosyltransferase involved in cell wall biosynthesis